MRALLRSTGLFSALRDEELERVSTDSKTIDAAPGETIVREGEKGDALYVIVEGDVQVFTFGRDGREVVLAKLGAGQFFGEQALLGRTDKRNASVRAFSKARLARVPREALQNALAKDDPLRRRLEQTGADQLHEKMLRSSVLFRSLRIAEGEWAEREELEPGAIVFKEGDPGTKFYLVLAGTAAVYKNESGGPRLIVRLREGQCFGELALLKNEPRSATVLAEGKLTVLSLPRDRFLELYEQTPELREYLETLSKVYVIPGRGFVTQHGGHALGFEAITSMYHLADGRRIVASRVVGREIASVAVVREGEPQRIRARDSDTGDHRELMVADGKIVGATAWGPWEQFGLVHEMILDDRPIEAWQLEVFKEKGALRLEDPAVFFLEQELVCSCMQVSQGAVSAAVREGCKTALEIGERTGAGTVCGACMPRLDEMVGHADWIPVSCTKVERLTDDVRAFRFEPTLGKLPPAKPGQHIVVQARIEGNWVQRPYTLTGSDERHYEITVKREPRGQFSSWLFDQMGKTALMRVSRPHGSFVVEDGRTAVWFVGGIGMTPALSVVRAAIATGQRVHVDYSCSRGLARRDELEAAAKKHAHISATFRNPREDGRLGRENVRATVGRFPGASFYICGPTSMNDGVARALSELGVPPERIRIEVFTPQGDKPRAAKPTERLGRKIIDAPNPVPPGKRPGEALAYPEVVANAPRNVLEEARAFLLQFFHEEGVPHAFAARWKDVASEIEKTGTYKQTYDELAWGARVAWRNSARCIGRLFWQGLSVRDARHVTTEEGVFQELVEHVKLATNGGNLRAVMTVFAPHEPGKPAPRIWNPQLVRYAGYQLEDGSWIGDPANVAITKAALRLGWNPGERTHFDLLPWIVQLPERAPALFQVPREIVLEVPISHPQFAWFSDLQLKWHALPAVSDMLFDTGGIHHTFAPFNGWYMGTEIGARNFADEHRYNMLPVIAKKMGLDTRRDRDLWRDRALVELNVAVLHSFEKAGVKMVDHHAASNDFMEFAAQEAAAGRRIDARWSWLVPPLSGGATKVFHVEWEETNVKPNYFYQPRAFTD